MAGVANGCAFSEGEGASDDHDSDSDNSDGADAIGELRTSRRNRAGDVPAQDDDGNARYVVCSCCWTC